MEQTTLFDYLKFFQRCDPQNNPVFLRLLHIYFTRYLGIQQSAVDALRQIRKILRYLHPDKTRHLESPTEENNLRRSARDELFQLLIAMQDLLKKNEALGEKLFAPGRAQYGLCNWQTVGFPCLLGATLLSILFVPYKISLLLLSLQMARAFYWKQSQKSLGKKPGFFVMMKGILDKMSSQKR